MKLRFKTDTFFSGKLEFEAGKIYEVSEENGWAGRWIKRGAEIVEEEGDKAQEPTEKEVLEEKVEVVEPKVKAAKTKKQKAQEKLEVL